MTTITTPPANTPDINDPTTFAERSVDWVEWQAVAYPQVNLVVAEIGELQTGALGAANYKGEWSSLTGAGNPCICQPQRKSVLPYQQPCRRDHKDAGSCS